MCSCSRAAAAAHTASPAQPMGASAPEDGRMEGGAPIAWVAQARLFDAPPTAATIAGVADRADIAAHRAVAGTPIAEATGSVARASRSSRPPESVGARQGGSQAEHVHPGSSVHRLRCRRGGAARVGPRGPSSSAARPIRPRRRPQELFILFFKKYYPVRDGPAVFFRLGTDSQNCKSQI